MSRVLFQPALACGALLALSACSSGPSVTSAAAPAALEELVDQVRAAVEEG